MVLFVNACVRGDSRTKRLADCLLARLDQPVTELCLADRFFPSVDEGFLKKRDCLLDRGELSDPIFSLACQFAQAEEIVIAAPYWDLSFPAALKQYLEQINVVGITFRYTEDGRPEGLCRARRLWYVMTAGGTFVPDVYGFGYVKALAESFYGIRTVELVSAVGLDLVGADAGQILEGCEKEILRRFGADR